MPPIVSIIMPVHNSERYLRETLNSIVSQTMNDFELICVDDHSVDGSLALLEEYCNKDPRITTVPNEGYGAGGARNTGLRYSSGKYLCFLDSDDVFDKNLLLLQCEALENTGADVSVCFSDEVSEKDGSIHVNPTLNALRIEANGKEDYFTFSALDNPRLTFSSTACLWNKLIRKTLIEDNHLECIEQPTINDGYLSYSSMALSKKCVCVPKTLVHYRCSQQSNLTSKHTKHPLDLLHSLETIIDKLSRSVLYDKRVDDLLGVICISEFTHALWEFDDRSARDTYLEYWRSSKLLQRVASQYEDYKFLLSLWRYLFMAEMLNNSDSVIRYFEHTVGIPNKKKYFLRLLIQRPAQVCRYLTKKMTKGR